MPRQKALPKKNIQIDINNENENRIFDKLLDYDFDEEVDDEEVRKERTHVCCPQAMPVRANKHINLSVPTHA